MHCEEPSSEVMLPLLPTGVSDRCASLRRNSAATSPMVNGSALATPAAIGVSARSSCARHERFRSTPPATRI